MADDKPKSITHTGEPKTEQRDGKLRDVVKQVQPASPPKQEPQPKK